MKSINPTVKAFTIIIAAVATAFSFSIKWNLIIVVLCLLLMLVSHVNLKRLIIVLIPATIAAFALAVAIYMGGNGSIAASDAEASRGIFSTAASAASMHDAMAVGLRIYVYFFLGMLFTLTTGANDFVYSLIQQCRIKPKYAYGVLAALNLMPMITREISQIRLAYRVRGYHIMPWSMRPVFSTLVNALHWSESLAMAMESKGFDEGESRTYYLLFKVKAKDILFAALIIAAALLGALNV